MDSTNQRILILQVENRPIIDFKKRNTRIWDNHIVDSNLYRLKNRRTLGFAPIHNYSIAYNTKIAQLLGYDYYLETNIYNPKLHPTWNKVNALNSKLGSYDLIIQLDTDAWIGDPSKFSSLISSLLDSEKIGAFSRDPYLKKNTFINAGVVIFKSTSKVKALYSEILQELQAPSSDMHNWPYEQAIISPFVHENREEFYIFKPDILNTPEGKIVRHNWFKDDTEFQSILNDFSSLALQEQILPDPEFDLYSLLDTEEYPNSSEVNKWASKKANWRLNLTERLIPFLKDIF